LSDLFSLSELTLLTQNRLSPSSFLLNRNLTQLAAETIALGVLSFPSVFNRLGMAVGIILVLVLAAASWYTGYVLIQFKVNHPGVMNFGDAGECLGKSI